MNDYTPTTAEVRAAAESDNPYGALEDRAFTRWLAAHDREVAAQAIEGFATAQIIRQGMNS